MKRGGWVLASHHPKERLGGLGNPPNPRTVWACMWACMCGLCHPPTEEGVRNSTTSSRPIGKECGLLFTYARRQWVWVGCNPCLLLTCKGVVEWPHLFYFWLGRDTRIFNGWSPCSPTPTSSVNGWFQLTQLVDRAAMGRPHPHLWRVWVGVIPMHVGMLLVGVSGGLNNLLMLFVGYSGGHLVGGREVGGPYTLFFFFCNT